MRTLLLISILIGFSPLFAHGEELNAGFVQGIWYAHNPVIAEVPNRIYVAFRNSTEHDLTGTVRFADNGLRIGSTEISALPGRLVEAWIDWKPRHGDHKITATLSDVEIHAIGGAELLHKFRNTSFGYFLQE